MEEETMSRFKILALIALFTFALGLALASDALAGEKIKFRAVWYTVKFEPLNVPGEEGRILYLVEWKGILTVFQGSKLLDGMVGSVVGYGDLNTKTGTGSGEGVIEWTDRDGDRIYWAYEAKAVKGVTSGPITVIRGTGKFEGLKGRATWINYEPAPNQTYTDWDGELEWSR